MDVSRLVDPVTTQITERPGRIVVLFLLVTAVLAVGLGNIQTEAGFESFTEDIPAERALQDIDREFGNRFGASTGSTQLIQSAPNVLAKPELLRMLEAQERLASHEELRVTSTSSAASIVATTIDPSATTPEQQIRTLERATPVEIERAVRTAADRNPQFTSMLSDDFNRQSASATATIGVVQHSVPAGLAAGAGVGGSSPLTSIQLRAQTVVDTVGGDIRVFGTGVFADEFSTVIADSLLLTIPAAILLIVLFLVIAYRDLVDLLLGAFALVLTVVWTFGFMGLVGIPFSQMLIAVPPLLLAIGIDFGIHSINRYREERELGREIGPAMRRTGGQLVVAFGIVAGTTVIGFLSNLSSSLVPIRQFGIVASIGILFTFLVFGIFLPAAKVSLDRLGQRYPIPVFSQRPLGSEGSTLGWVLSGGVTLARVAPAVVVLLAVVGSVGAGYYATGVDTEFTQEDFLPPAELHPLLTELPEPFRPSDYTVVRDLNFLEAKFASSQDDSVTVLLRAPMERDVALETIHRAGRDPPGSFVRDGRHAESTSIVTVIRDQADRDPEFAAVVARNDRDGNGVPDRNLDRVYDALLATPAGDQARTYLTEDRRTARVVYSVKSDPSQAEVATDARSLADRYRVSATATGNTVVFQAISNVLLESAVVSLAIALALVAGFLLVSYRLLEGYATLGVANLVPIIVTVAALGATMRLAGIAFNAFTATILAITIGLGIDYSVHVTHRFADELAEREPMPALSRTVRGTGGALTGSMFTTVFGIGVLVLAVFPAIGQFGVLTGLSVLYAYLASLVVLPSVLMVWARLVSPRHRPHESLAGSPSIPDESVPREDNAYSESGGPWLAMTAIRAANVSKAFGEIQALDGLSLSVHAGELYGLLGPNGAGKTTAIRILTGQLVPDAGRVSVLEVDPVAEPVEARRRIGVLPEQASPPSFLSPREYFEFVGTVRELDDAVVTERTREWADRLAFAEKLDTLNTDLSRGQQQKVMITATFLHEPALVFIDEPLVNLDPIVQARVKQYLTSYVDAGNAVFLSTHHIEVAQQLCSRVGIVRDGRLVTEREPQTLGPGESLLDVFLTDAQTPLGE